MAYELHEMDCRLAMSMLMEPNSVDSIVCDPPYGLSKEPDMAEVLRHWLNGDDYTHTGSGFMGKSWDSFVPGPSVWREAYRVLKPGGYLIAFFGTRTYDLGTLAIRLAGFEIRDQLAWVFGSGFPKSLDVSKAIDKMDAVEVRRDRALRFTEWVRSVGLSSSLIDELTGTNMGGHYTTAASQPAVATRAHLEILRPMFGEAPDWVEQIVDERTVESENYASRPITQEAARGQIATGTTPFDMRSSTERERRDTPTTDAAKQWQGWGTALKPAYEPIVLARKPFDCKTVAANVLTHGTGALNVDGCRVAASPEDIAVQRARTGGVMGTEIENDIYGKGYLRQPAGHDAGRWPANLCHDGSDEVLAEFPTTTSGKMRAGTIRAAQDEPGSVVYGTYGGNATDTDTIGDTGSAARFFYCAKASKADRGAGNGHPTVKPTDLMRWLCRLVTPPGGTVLDPFTGSGSTGKAALLEGFQFVGCEMTPEYAAIAHARLAYAAASLPE